MKTETFKKLLAENKEILRGKSLSILTGTGDWAETFTTLNDFGAKILELDKKGYQFSFEGSLTTVRALYAGAIPTPTLEQRTAEIKAFGTAA